MCARVCPGISSTEKESPMASSVTLSPSETGGVKVGIAAVGGVVMGRGDRGELEILSREVVEHRRRVAGIDHHGVGAAAQRPDIIVLERLDRNDLERIASWHEPAVLRAKRGAEV